MKIIFLEAVQNFGGARKSTVELASRLRKREGIETLIVDFWGCCKPFIEAVETEEIPCLILDKREEPVILSSSSKFKMIVNYVKYIKLLIAYRKKLEYIVSSFGADIIIVNNTKVLSILKKSSQLKVLFFARGWFLPKTITALDRFLIKRLCDSYVAVSQATRQSIYAGGFAKLDEIYVVQNSFNAELIENIRREGRGVVPWHLNEVAREFKILHCGGFLESKGQTLLLDIAERLRTLSIPFKIILVGVVYKGEASEKFYRELVAKIEEGGLQDSFELEVNQPNALRYFDQCDILVHPSHTEGLPRVVMEAMAFGKPVIGNAVGGMTDYILNHYTGYVTNFNKVEEYVTAILDLYYNKEKYAFMSDNSSKLIEKAFTPQNQIDSFIKVIKAK